MKLQRQARPALPTDRQAPNAPEAEKAVLSTCLQSQEALGESTEHLVPEDFFVPKHRNVFQALTNLTARGEPTDVVTVAAELETLDLYAEAGGSAYLAELLDYPSSPANTIHHARIVAERSRLRELIRISHESARDAYEGGAVAADLLDAAQNEFFKLAEQSERRGYRALRDLAGSTFTKIQEAFHNKEDISGVASGFVELDKLTGGWQDGDLIILAARPSMGKTALALNLAWNAAYRSRDPVGVFSLEMSSEQLVMRLISCQGRLDNHALRTGKLKAQDWPRLTEAMSQLTNTQVYIDDSSGINLLELRSKARRMVQIHGVKMILIDYLQLVTTSGRIESRQQEISLISRSLKGLAKDLGVPIIALSQLSRAVESRENKRPMLSDLRESGAIEQDADVVMFIYRHEYYVPEDIEQHNLAELIIGKQRNGPVGTCKLHFERRFTLFSNLSRAPEPGRAGPGGGPPIPPVHPGPPGP